MHIPSAEAFLQEDASAQGAVETYDGPSHGPLPDRVEGGQAGVAVAQEMPSEDAQSQAAFVVGAVLHDRGQSGLDSALDQEVDEVHEKKKGPDQPTKSRRRRNQKR